MAMSCQRPEPVRYTVMPQDLRELDRRHGARKVCLRMAFKRGLHPFYPPAVQVLRPRMRGPLASALASHPALQLPHWDPWRSQKHLLEQLRAFLQARAWPFIAIQLPSWRNSLARPHVLNGASMHAAHLASLVVKGQDVCLQGSRILNFTSPLKGKLRLQQNARVNLESALNSAHRETAYTRLERLLAHLEALTGLLPACIQQHAAMYRRVPDLLSPIAPCMTCPPASAAVSHASASLTASARHACMGRTPSQMPNPASASTWTPRVRSTKQPGASNQLHARVVPPWEVASKQQDSVVFYHCCCQ